MSTHISRKLAAIAGGLALVATGSTVAAEKAHDSGSAIINDWQAMNEKIISADEVMSGDVTNGFNQMGSVRDLVLTPDRTRVEYILYEARFPYTFYGATDGYVAFDNVAFDSMGLNDLNVRIDDDASMQDPQQLKLTRRQANNRLLSNLEEESVSFSDDDGAGREIENLLIDRRTGEITHYVVAMNDNSLFNTEPRAIPAAHIDIDADGNISTDLSLKTVMEADQIDPEYLK